MLAHVAGDRSAFPELFRRYAPLLRNVLLSQLPLRAEVDDLVQQTFLQVHRARFDFDPNQPLRPWIFTIAFNLKRELARRRKRRPEAPLDESLFEVAGNAAAEERFDAANALNVALAKLPADQLEVIALHWFGGLSFAEVAATVGASTAAVKVRAHRGYVTLRSLLRGGGGVSGNSRPESGIPAVTTGAAQKAHNGLR